jgi:hypothetical protein
MVMDDVMTQVPKDDDDPIVLKHMEPMLAPEQKRNLKTPIKTRTLLLHLSEPYDSRSTTHAAMQPRKDKS